MPFKSQAQRRKFAQLLVEGKISNETFEEWNRETGGKKLKSAFAQRRSQEPSPEVDREQRRARRSDHVDDVG